MPLEPPPTIDKNAGIAEVRYAENSSGPVLIATSKKLQRELDKALRSLHNKVPTEPKPIYVTEIPPLERFQSISVSEMKLPHGRWQYEKVPCGLPGAYNVNLRLKNEPKTEINFCSDAVPAGKRSSFMAILAKEPYELSKEEIKTLYPERVFSKIHSEEINGKRVVIFEDHFDLKEEKVDVYQLEFNHNPSNFKIVVPTTITFSAPPALYKRHIKEVKEALQTIKWNEYIIDPGYDDKPAAEAK
ncbi:hypothetical protein BH11CYA1_BH11CYA1_47180 [soil metagenome]